MKGVKRISALLCCLCLLCACQGGGQPGPLTGQTAREAVRLRTASPFGGTDAFAPGYQEMIRVFCQNNPEIKIADESIVSSETWKAKIISDFAAGNEPDVLFFFTGADARQLIRKEKVVPLSTIRLQYPDYGGNIKPQVMEYMTEYNGNIYALPVRGIWEGLFCNRDLFSSYGMPLPKDWQSLIEAIAGFAKEDITPIAISFTDVPHYLIEHLVLAAGGVQEHRFVPLAGIGISQYPKSWITALEQFRVFTNLGAFAPEAWTSTNDMAQQMFLDKRAAMILNGSWFCGMVEDTENTLVLPFPAMPDSKMQPGEIVSGYSMGFYITQKAWTNSEKRDAAVKFVSDMTSDDAIVSFSQGAGIPTADIDVKRADTPFERSGTQLWKNAPDSAMPIDSRLPKRAWETLYLGVGPVALGERSARELLNEVAQRNH